MLVCVSRDVAIMASEYGSCEYLIYGLVIRGDVIFVVLLFIDHFGIYYTLL